MHWKFVSYFQVLRIVVVAYLFDGTTSLLGILINIIEPKAQDSFLRVNVKVALQMVFEFLTNPNGKKSLGLLDSISCHTYICHH